MDLRQSCFAHVTFSVALPETSKGGTGNLKSAAAAGCNSSMEASSLCAGLSCPQARGHVEGEAVSAGLLQCDAGAAEGG